MKKALILMVLGLFTVLTFDSCKTIIVSGDKGSTEKIVPNKNKQGTIVFAPLLLPMFTQPNYFGEGVPNMQFETWKGHGLYTLGGRITLSIKVNNSSVAQEGDVFTIYENFTYQTIIIEPETRMTVLDYDINTGAIWTEVNDGKVNCILCFAPGSEGKFYLTGVPTGDGRLKISYENGMVFFADNASCFVHLGFNSVKKSDVNAQERIEPGTKTGGTSGTFNGSTGMPGNYFAPNTGNNNNSNNSNSNNGVFKNNSSTGTGNTGTGINLPD